MDARAYGLVMFNMTKMKWKRVDLPMGTVATYDSDCEEDEAFNGATIEENEPDSAEDW